MIYNIKMIKVPVRINRAGTFLNAIGFLSIRFKIIGAEDAF